MSFKVHSVILRDFLSAASSPTPPHSVPALFSTSTGMGTGLAPKSQQIQRNSSPKATKEQEVPPYLLPAAWHPTTCSSLHQAAQIFSILAASRVGREAEMQGSYCQGIISAQICTSVIVSPFLMDTLVLQHTPFVEQPSLSFIQHPL